MSRVYGASDPSLGVSYSGFVNGETSSVLGRHAFGCRPDAATTTAVGTYASVITASGQTSTNYTITYVAGESDRHAGPADDHGQRRVASLWRIRPALGRNLLGIRER